MAGSQVQDVIVIGAGVVGICSALALQSRGRSVLIVDRQKTSQRASEMNAGAFAFSDIEPLATPGIMRKAPKWLLDPLGPLSIPPSYAFKIAPWMLRFWRASWPDRHQLALRAQASLMQVSQSALYALVADVDGEELLQREGQLQLFEGAKEFAASLPVWQRRGEHGVRFELLETPDAIAAYQPGLDRRFTHAGFTPDWINTCDPARWLDRLRARFLERGGEIGAGDVKTLKSESTCVSVQLEGKCLGAKQVVVCAGAWSHHIARSIGDRIPLETERGYNTTLPQGAFDLKTHLSFSGHGFVVTRINGGVRVGGAVELGGLNLEPNYKRSEILLKKAQSFLPGLKTEGGRQWMGFRPSLPDSLPVIDRSPNDRRVLYAFGHGHLGLTQSAGTAELVAALASDASLPIDMSAFSARRF
ncbi:FAD-binding oxidoreductase [uncultured Roseibium sp.]|uniref:NAD(P)/FAD-dependent oxidoreductase n=1 Tax=uncultured Roseibium sp. TaxID=1936171 RepID=UPI0026314E4F|nr:FAD-binding oxidoreductase [uncultured Roseibium sp.]